MELKNDRIYNNFDQNFNMIRHLPIAIYGIGINTGKLLELNTDYNIISVIANERIGDIVYGKEVISIDSIPDEVKIVVIVAQMKSIKTIYKRIKAIEDKGIQIFDFFGNNLSENSKYQFMQDINQNILNQMKAKIDGYDIVSFDFWDTLIMRKVLRPEDIYELIQYELNQNELTYKVKVLNFKELRLKAEQILVDQGVVPNLEKIYNIIREVEHKIDVPLSRTLLDMEVRIEVNHSVQRESVVNLLNYAISQNKKVYLMCETAMSSEQIKKVINSCNIAGLNDYELVVSSEIRRKTAGTTLYEYLKKESGVGKCLHFGSKNVEFANDSNIDFYYIPSSIEMLREPFEGIVDSAPYNFYANLSLGLLASKLYNDPFEFQEQNKKARINTTYELGYSCFGAPTLKYLSWLIGNLKNNEDSLLLFSSRDGYFLHKLYEEIRSEHKYLNLPKDQYFYISRRAVTVAAIRNRDDIIKIVESVLKLSVGKLSLILEERLGLNSFRQDELLNCQLADLVGRDDKLRIVNRVLEYSDQIINNASIERENYLNYIDEVLESNYDQIFLFDLYTKGTSYFQLNSLISSELNLVCFGLKDYPNEYISNTEHVKAMFGKNELSNYSWFERFYQIFEVAYASTEGQLRCFDDKGLPQFVPGSQYDEKEINELQQGILDYIYDYNTINTNWVTQDLSLELADSFIGLLDSRKTVISAQVSKGFSYYDGFASDELRNIWEDLI